MHACITELVKHTDHQAIVSLSAICYLLSDQSAQFTIFPSDHTRRFPTQAHKLLKFCNLVSINSCAGRDPSKQPHPFHDNKPKSPVLPSPPFPRYRPELRATTISSQRWLLESEYPCRNPAAESPFGFTSIAHTSMRCPNPCPAASPVQSRPRPVAVDTRRRRLQRLVLTYPINRNKRLSKGKKGLKKRTQDPFARKDWYSIKAPSPFNVREYAPTNQSTRSK